MVKGKVAEMVSNLPYLPLGHDLRGHGLSLYCGALPKISSLIKKLMESSDGIGRWKAF